MIPFKTKVVYSKKSLHIWPTHFYQILLESIVSKYLPKRKVQFMEAACDATAFWNDVLNFSHLNRVAQGINYDVVTLKKN